MVYSENTFYVFVLYVLPRRRMLGKAKNYLVIPSLDLKELIESGQIVLKKGSDHILNIFVYPDEERRTWTYRNKGNEVDFTPYWNDFGKITGS
jgi:hypothetical protein